MRVTDKIKYGYAGRAYRIAKQATLWYWKGSHSIVKPYWAVRVFVAVFKGNY